ncbi:response regulator [Candidatus Sumerlaeota bacterium]|nr:response regulator [Candidatus Sumerlaeota bacterium]
MSAAKRGNPLIILLVEDNPADVRLTQEALREGKMAIDLLVAKDGRQAMDMLRRKPPFSEMPRPDIILLDLNMPKMDGREALAQIKRDPALKAIPVVVLTTSKAEEDILRSYNLHCNCYITKPVEFDQFMHIVRSIEDFWFSIVKLPPKPDPV